MSNWAALYPGQGSQHPGMGKFLFDSFPYVKHLFEEASDAIAVDFKKLCFDGSDQDLALTENTQPCLLLVSVATHQALKNEFNFIPQAAAGHSIGEYAAVVCAGGLGFSNGIKAVRARGQAMQRAVPVGQGGMTAILGLDAQEAKNLCTWAERESDDGPVSPANLNAPGQIVISGKKSVLDWLSQNFKSDMFPGKRVKFIALNVSAPFHCAMMKPAEEEMKTVLGAMEFSNTSYPIVQNVNAQSITEGSQLRENLIQQVSAPVRWIECIQELLKCGANSAVESGCGKVLSGLSKKIDEGKLKTFNVNSLDELRAFGDLLKDG